MVQKAKEILAKEIASRVQSGMLIGVGTGTTVDMAIAAIGVRVQNEGLNLTAICSSHTSVLACHAAGIVVIESDLPINFGFDGADAVDKRRRAIKGKGGAMLKEKILAERCECFVLIVDSSKFAENIADHSAVPVEIVPHAREQVVKALKTLGAKEIKLREGVSGASLHGPVFTEYGGNILDVSFDSVSDTLEHDIKCITGVVESGLFLSQADEVLLAGDNGLESF